jgi:hypothetical protein
MNKKAQMEYIKILILAIIFLLVAIPLVIKIQKVEKEASREAACKTSVEMHARSHIKGFDLSGNIKCPTKDLTVTTSKPEEIKKTFADEMAECWGIFGEGKLELFSGEGIYCAVCSRINFKDKNEKIMGFSEFLIKTKMPSNKVTYLDYLTGYKTPNAELYAQDILSRKPVDIQIDTSKTYSTIFVYAKGKAAINNLEDAVGGKGKAMAITGVAGGVAAGAGAVTIALFLGSNPIGWATAGAIIIGAGAAAVLTYFAGEPSVWMALTTLTEYTQPELQSYGCKYLEVEQS